MSTIHLKTSSTPATASTHSTSAPSAKKVAPLAYAAFLSSVPVVIFPFWFPVPLVLSILALRSIARNPNYVGKGRALFGMWWGVLGMVLSIVVFLLLMNG
jgi:hypothetical protein